MTKPVIVEAEHGPFWSCVDVILDEDGNYEYKNLIVRYKGGAVLALSDNADITAYFMCNVLTHIEIMKIEVANEVDDE